MKIYVPAGTDILMVDDDSDFHYILSRLIKRTVGEETSLVSAYSGEEGLKYLLEGLEAGRKLPGVILMDINMPGMSGFETVSAIREHDGLQELPIIVMLSSSQNERDIKKAIDCGANEYYEKPISINSFEFTIV